ncbi:LysR substrate-binding domain-containing protein, partial [Streptomyces sp. NPDC003233]
DTAADGHGHAGDGFRRDAAHGLLDLTLDQVELGEVVTLLPESVTTRYPRPGVVYRELPDTPPVTLSIAWPQQSRSTATAALIRAATAVAPVGVAP